MPRFLQQKIHSEFSTDTSTWSGYRQNIIDLQNAVGSGILTDDFNDHLIREYNRKILALKLGEDQLFFPYDAGLRYISGNV